MSTYNFLLIKKAIKQGNNIGWMGFQPNSTNIGYAYLIEILGFD